MEFNDWMEQKSPACDYIGSPLDKEHGLPKPYSDPNGTRQTQSFDWFSFQSPTPNQFAFKTEYSKFMIHSDNDNANPNLNWKKNVAPGGKGIKIPITAGIYTITPFVIIDKKEWNKGNATVNDISLKFKYPNVWFNTDPAWFIKFEVTGMSNLPGGAVIRTLHGRLLEQNLVCFLCILNKPSGQTHLF